MDYFASGLTQEVSVEILDRKTRASLGTLDGVDGFSVEKNLYNTLRGGGSMTVDLQTPIEWGKVMLRIWLTLRLGTEEESHPLLTAFPSLSGSSETVTGVRVTPVLKDPTTLLDDLLGRHWAYPEGTVVTEAMAEVFDELGLSEVRITPSASTLRSPFTKGPEETYRNLLTGLGEAIGYGATWTDSMGVYRIEPYIEPGLRAEVFRLGYGDRSVTLPTVETEEKLEAPNHFVLTTGDEDPLVAEGWNDDPESPYSVVNQRVIPYTEQVEAVDQATLDAKLAQVMASEALPDTRYTVQFRWFPIDPERQIELQDAGRYVSPQRVVRGVVVREPVDARVTMTNMSFSWSKGDPLSKVTAVLRGAL